MIFTGLPDPGVLLATALALGFLGGLIKGIFGGGKKSPPPPPDKRVHSVPLVSAPSRSKDAPRERTPPLPHLAGLPPLKVPEAPRLAPRPLIERAGGDDPKIGQAPTYTAQDYRTVTPEQTVQGRLEKIFQKGSPLLSHARARAFQHAAARGLLNTSLAGETAEQAVYENALPIARDDAAIHRQAWIDTHRARDEAERLRVQEQGAHDRAQLQSKTSLLSQRLGLQNTRDIAELESQTQLTNTWLSQQNERDLEILGMENERQIRVLELEHESLLRSQVEAATLFQTTLDNIRAIQTQAGEDALTHEAKRQAIQSQINILREALRAIGSQARTSPADIANLDLSQFFEGVSVT